MKIKSSQSTIIFIASIQKLYVDILSMSQTYFGIKVIFVAKEILNKHNTFMDELGRVKQYEFYILILIDAERWVFLMFEKMGRYGSSIHLSNR